MSAKIRLARVGKRSKPFYRIVVMDEGRAIAEGKPDAVSRDSRVIEAYLGSSRAGGA